MIDTKRRKQNAVVAAVVMVVVLLVSFAGFYQVGEGERVVVTTFGRVASVGDAGAHFRVPFVQRLHRIPVVVQVLDELGMDEYEGLMITRDFNLVYVDFYVEWRVYDPVRYLFGSEDPRGLLGRTVLAETRQAVAGADVDEVLTTGRAHLEIEVRDRVRERLEEADIGVFVTTVLLYDVRLPNDDVAAAFLGVENARLMRDAQINEAMAYETAVIADARAMADRIVTEAEGAKAARINEAIGQAARFEQLFEGYQLNPDLTRTRMYLEAMEAVLPGATLHVGGGE